ncbi:MAG: multidrug ABC transporter substrate-binding protein [Alphaproteobacteria bacterium CG1_02_46_17]|nr:MAG: multidrug ABC transporter substrate-binding protein [Alphaproteobacteria bacterium CG1_02_46_17]
MYSQFEIMMAMRYLRARKAEGFVSVIAAFSFIGIMIGVATLIIVMSVMNGFHIQLVDRIVGLNGHLNVFVTGGPIQNYQSLLNDLERVDGVVSAAPVVEGQVLVTSHGQATGAMARGFTQEYFSHKPLLSSSIESGSMDDFSGNVVAIGIKMAERFEVQVGDMITLMSPNGKASPFGTIPRTAQYKVVMIFDVGMYEYNSGYVFMPLDSAQRFFQFPETSANLLEIMSDHPEKIDKIKTALSVVTNGRAGVYDWRDSNKSFFSAVEVERNVMFIILMLIILIAAFNIISSMIMLVNDKARGIAIMRTMGAFQSSILKIFILTGASVGIAGTAMGAALGILFAVNIESIRRFFERLTDSNLFPGEVYFLSKLPADVDWVEVTFIIAIAVVVSILATIYPARRAAKLDPVEALRYE